MDGLQCVVVSPRRRKRLPEEAVTLALTNLGSDRRVEGRVHRQCQGDDAVAAVDGLQRVFVGSRRGKRLPEEAVGLALTDLSGDRGVENGVHGQVQRVLARAAVGIGVREGVCPGCGVGVPVPFVAFTGRFIEYIVRAVEDGEVHRHGAVAAVRRREHLRVFARLRVFDTVPVTEIANSGVKCCEFVVKYGQVDSQETVATHHVGQGLLVEARQGVLLPVEGEWQVIFQNVNVEGTFGEIVHRHGQRDHAVAAVDRL